LDLALRSTRRPLSNHPNEPLGTGTNRAEGHQLQGRVRGLQPEAEDDGGEPRAWPNTANGPISRRSLKGSACPE